MGTPLDNATVHQPVAIAGCGAISALGSGSAVIADALRQNTAGLRPGSLPGNPTHPPVVGGWVPAGVLDRLRDADPPHADARAFLMSRAALTEARDAAGQSLAGIPPERRGLVLSTTKADIEALERLVAGRPCPAAAARHIQPARLALDLAAALDLRGPVQCVSAACISGLLALQQGAQLIQQNAVDAALVCGVDLISHFVLAGFNTLKSLDPDGCRPFDRARVGLSLGEGAGAVVLMRQDRAEAGAVVLEGWGSSNDANHLTGPSRDGAGLALAMQRALRRANAPATSIDYVHAHGTGTPYNDAMEAQALRRGFGDHVPPFGSSKGVFGHTLGAAGLLETILCVLALDAGLLPGTPRLREPDPVAPASLLLAPRPAPGFRRVLKVNCGFGGTNAAIVLARSSPPLPASA